MDVLKTRPGDEWYCTHDGCAATTAYAFALCADHAPGDPTSEKAVWTTAYVNDLPNSAFLYVEPGEKDGDGKTVPRSKRHFPVRDASGALSVAHVRNAIARIPQSNAPGLSAEKKRQLQDRARRLLSELNEKTAEDSMDDTITADKAGRRMSRRWLDRLNDMVSAITDLKKWAGYEEDSEAQKSFEIDTDATFYVFKDADGEDRWLSFSSNGFVDRTGEIVSTGALEKAVEKAATEKDHYGPLRLWHVPEADIGTCDFQAVQGRFLIESGTFFKSETGQKALSALRGWEDPLGTSIGFRYPLGTFKEGVYEEIEIVERSVCPLSEAANPWTAFQIPGGDMARELSDQQREFLRKTLGEGIAHDVISRAEKATTVLEGAVAYKTTPETLTEEEKSFTGDLRKMLGEIKDSEAKSSMMAAFNKAFGDPDDEEDEEEMSKTDPGGAEDEVVVTMDDITAAVSAAIAEVTRPLVAAQTRQDEALASLTETVKALTAAAEKTAEPESHRPRAANGGLAFRATVDPATLLDPEAAKAATGEGDRPTTSPVAVFIEDLKRGIA